MAIPTTRKRDSSGRFVAIHDAPVEIVEGELRVYTFLPPDLLWDGTREQECLSYVPAGPYPTASVYYCSRRKHADGQHAATIGAGYIVHVWESL